MFLRRIGESIQTAFEHYLISRATHTQTGQLTPEHAKKIGESLTGADIVENDKNSFGRDTQFELYVGALLAMGGVPVKIAEPDLHFAYRGEMVGLAAKRVKQKRKIRVRFKEAAEQILRSGLRGFIAVNTDLLITEPALRDNTQSRGAQFDERLAVLAELDQKFSSHPHVTGRFAFGTDFTWHLDTERPTLEVGMFRQFKIYAYDEREIEDAKSFYREFNVKLEARMQSL